MYEENQREIEEVTSLQSEEGSESNMLEGSEEFASSEILVTSPVDPRTMTTIETDKGDIHVIHEITLGDVILSTLLMAILIFKVIESVIRR